jgi:hypothetical protein
VKKLVIQIPCYNEEASLAITPRALPRDVAGFEKTEWLIVNDGSKDRTVAITRENGVDHVVELGAQKNVPIKSVPIRTNADLRPSRLMKSMRACVNRSILTILRISVTYKPFRVFLALGTIPFALGTPLGLRWQCFFAVEGSTRTRLPSLILAAILILIGVQLWIVGIVADIVAVNRRLLEDIQTRVKRLEYR